MSERREIMLRRDLGLTKLYNLVNDPAIADAADPDVARLRAIHVELDEAVMDAYGWSDVPLDHGFHTTARWSAGPSARPRESRSSTGCWRRTTRAAAEADQRESKRDGGARRPGESVRRCVARVGRCGHRCRTSAADW